MFYDYLFQCNTILACNLQQIDAIGEAGHIQTAGPLFCYGTFQHLLTVDVQ